MWLFFNCFFFILDRFLVLFVLFQPSWVAVVLLSFFRSCFLPFLFPACLLVSLLLLFLPVRVWWCCSFLFDLFVFCLAFVSPVLKALWGILSGLADLGIGAGASASFRARVLEGFWSWCAWLFPPREPGGTQTGTQQKWKKETKNEMWTSLKTNRTKAVAVNFVLKKMVTVEFVPFVFGTGA